MVPFFPALNRNPETGLLPPPDQYDRYGDFLIFQDEFDKRMPRSPERQL
jgi:hypothetical protein